MGIEDRVLTLAPRSARKFRMASPFLTYLFSFDLLHHLQNLSLQRLLYFASSQGSAPDNLAKMIQTRKGLNLAVDTT